MLDVEINNFKNIYTVSLFNGTYIEYCISEKTSNYMNATLILDNSCTATAITKSCKTRLICVTHKSSICMNMQP